MTVVHVSDTSPVSLNECNKKKGLFLTVADLGFSLLSFSVVAIKQRPHPPRLARKVCDTVRTNSRYLYYPSAIPLISAYATNRFLYRPYWLRVVNRVSDVAGATFVTRLDTEIYQQRLLSTGPCSRPSFA